MQAVFTYHFARRAKNPTHGKRIMKKVFLLILLTAVALSCCLSLTACGASSKTAASVDSSANDHPAESPAVTEEKGYFDADTNGYDDEGRDSGGGVLENQKIIYTCLLYTS